MKRLMLLGGSHQQMPPIEYARSRGYYTILCDCLSDNPGQHIADKFYPVSTTDKEAVLQIAQDEKIDGILAYASDPAAPTAAYTAENLGLPTSPYRSVNILSNKDLYREFLAQHSFCTPRAKGYSSLESAMSELLMFRLPVLVKPVDSSGSKGVSLVGSQVELSAAVASALSFSRCKRFIIEEYVEIDGCQVAGDGFSVDGKLIFRLFGNDHFYAGNINPFVPVSASFPSLLPEKVQNKIHDEIERLLKLLGMKTGAYNFDIRVDKNQNVYLMEVAPRNGGCYIPKVIDHAVGVDLTAISVEAALGNSIGEIKPQKMNGCWAYFSLYSEKKGILGSINFCAGIEKNIVEAHYTKKIGDTVDTYSASNSSLGILIMRFDNIDEMLATVNYPQNWLHIVIKEDVNK